jgi:hypothetical protein
MKRLVAPLLVVLGAACLAGAGPPRTQEYWPDGPPADNRSDFVERLLDLHNRERARIGQAPLAWDARLAEHARAWANRLAARGRFEHSLPATRPGEGENLWRGTAGAYSLEEMIGHFLAERRDFRPGIFPQVARHGDWHQIAHYTQMIWPTTRTVGCAMTSRRGTDYLVCRYAPAGNVVGQRVP